MVRHIKRKGKTTSVKKKVDARHKREAEEAELADQQKRARLHNTAGDDDQALFDVLEDTGYVGNDDDSDGFFDDAASPIHVSVVPSTQNSISSHIGQCRFLSMDQHPDPCVSCTCCLQYADSE